SPRVLLSDQDARWIAPDCSIVYESPMWLSDSTLPPADASSVFIAVCAWALTVDTEAIRLSLLPAVPQCANAAPPSRSAVCELAQSSGSDANSPPTALPITMPSAAPTKAPMPGMMMPPASASACAEVQDAARLSAG